MWSYRNVKCGYSITLYEQAERADRFEIFHFASRWRSTWEVLMLVKSYKWGQMLTLYKQCIKCNSQYCLAKSTAFNGKLYCRGGDPNIWRRPPKCYKSLNWQILSHSEHICIVHTWAGIEITTLVMIRTDCSVLLYNTIQPNKHMGSY